MTVFSKKNHRGQTLIEIVVAVGIIAVVLVGVSDLVTRSLNLASFQADKHEAENIAQNQLNYYRQARDIEPTNFFSEENPQRDYSECVGAFNIEKYECSIAYVNVANGVEMTVTIVWNDGDKQISIPMTQVLSIPTK